MLWGAAVEYGFNAPMWMTFNQSAELNAHVKKGEKGSLVVYANKITKTEDDGKGNEVERDIPFINGVKWSENRFWVFRVSLTC